MLRFKNTKIGRKLLDLLQREWVVSVFRKAVVLCLVVLAVVGALAALVWYIEYDAWHAEAQIKAASDKGRVEGPWSRHDLICFSNMTGWEPGDFKDVLRKAGHEVKNFVERCNDAPSDTLGFIGVVSGDKIRCTVVHLFYVLEGKRAACIPPRRLSVTKQIFQARAPMPGRAWYSEPGQSYYSIREVER